MLKVLLFFDVLPKNILHKVRKTIMSLSNFAVAYLTLVIYMEKNMNKMLGVEIHKSLFAQSRLRAHLIMRPVPFIFVVAAHRIS